MIKVNNLLKIIVFINISSFAYNTEQHTYISSNMFSLIIKKSKKEAKVISLQHFKEVSLFVNIVNFKCE